MNVYVVVPFVVVLITEGLHVPAMPFVDVVGKAGAVLFWHKGPIDKEEDRERIERLRASGWTVLVYWYDDLVARPAAVARELGAATSK